ncbi:MAG: hypothetical protein HRF40_02945 [Nitrososphaera sp.]
MPPTYVYGQISLDFKLKDGKLTKATFKYKYFAKDDTIEFVDIQYSDPRLQEIFDGNDRMLKRVDEYIRNLLSRQAS